MVVVFCAVESGLYGSAGFTSLLLVTTVDSDEVEGAGAGEDAGAGV